MKVLLSGEGSDELFGGYVRYARFLWSQEHPILSRREDIACGRIRLWKDPIRKFISSSIWYNPNDLNSILKNGNVNNAIERRVKIYESIPGKCESMQRFLNYEMRTYLSNILLRQDKMSMANSIETRVPFLDYKLVEMVRRQPLYTYLRGDASSAGMNTTKIPLKRLAHQKYGEEFAYRGKCGFSLPLQKYFVDKKFSSVCEEEIIPSLLELQWLQKEEVMRLWKKRSEINYNSIEKTLWIILSFGQWWHIFGGNKKNVLNGISM